MTHFWDIVPQAHTSATQGDCSHNHHGCPGDNVSLLSMSLSSLELPMASSASRDGICCPGRFIHQQSHALTLGSFLATFSYVPKLNICRYYRTSGKRTLWGLPVRIKYEGFFLITFLSWVDYADEGRHSGAWYLLYSQAVADTGKKRDIWRQIDRYDI